MVRNPIDHSLDSVELGKLCRESSAGLARLRSALPFMAGRMNSMILDDSAHDVGVARVASMVVCSEPERFYSPDAEPKSGPESRRVPWVGTRTSADGLDPWAALQAECDDTAAKLARLAAAFRPGHPDVADRWAALAETVRGAWRLADRSRSKPEPTAKPRNGLARTPRPVKIKAGRDY